MYTLKIKPETNSANICKQIFGRIFEHINLKKNLWQPMHRLQCLIKNNQKKKKQKKKQKNSGSSEKHTMPGCACTFGTCHIQVTHYNHLSHSGWPDHYSLEYVSKHVSLT